MAKVSNTYGKMSVKKLEAEYARRISDRQTDKAYGIQNAMGDANLDAIRAELERRGKTVRPFRGR